eukprot:gnl/MRDRNA2_/MRDRNA2_96329_c0_seq1.p1 gnl/MRDRNA2_/MRDRNA2_96329_c0~~gnl/MRDRNA2_/MRDRNA2_96329_c0_seq1.p1  ORF type:complete len:483 (+),score=87.48 gnl/MRDRNA2_/MRDRNA2_96329_c0_seq1:57-1505(+)
MASKPGDWSCPECGDLQFSRNSVCRRCGAPKPDDSSEGSALPDASAATRLFLTKIAPHVDKPEVFEVFSGFGDVVDCYMPSARGRSGHKGICFVEYASVNSVIAAIQAAPHYLGDQQITVDIATPRGAPPPGREDKNEVVWDAGGDGIISNRLFLGSVPADLSNEDLAEYFSRFGEIEDIYIPAGKGIAYVSFVDATAADAAVEQQPHSVADGVQITAEIAKGKGFGKGSSKPGDWTCPACGDLQFSRNLECRKCGEPKPDGAGKGKGKAWSPGDWECPACGDHQFSRNQECRKCGEPKPENAGRARDTEFRDRGKGIDNEGKGKGKGGDWYCPACDDLQFARNLECRKCGCPKPEDAEEKGKGKSKGKGKPGDWNCPECGDLQFSTRMECRRCGAPKPEDFETRQSDDDGRDKGKGKGKRVSMPGDWRCPQCDDLQFSRNWECRKCGCPKPRESESETPSKRYDPYGAGDGKGKGKGKQRH